MKIEDLPKIDRRDSKDLFEEFIKLIPAYTPEWITILQSNRDSGIVLAKIFVEIIEEIITHINEMPSRNFIEFLNLIEVNHLSSMPSYVPVTLTLSEGVTQDVVLEEGTKFETESNDKHPALEFESIENILVTRSQILEIYSSIPMYDLIYRYTDNFMKRNPFILFAQEDFPSIFSSNLQSHILYLGHDDLFNIKSGEIIITIYFTTKNKTDTDFLKEILDNKKLVSWQYDWKIDLLNNRELIDSYKEFFSKVEKQDDHTVLVTLNKIYDFENEIPIRKIDGMDSRWIRCKLFPLHTFTDTLSKELFWKSLNPPLIETIGITVYTKSELNADLLAYNDIQIPLETDIHGSFYRPFGIKPLTLDSFYIASYDAFSKKGLSINIRFEFIHSISHKMFAHLDSTYPVLSWEYWNGSTWAKIDDALILPGNPPPGSPPGQPIYENEIKFTCPNDIKPVIVIGKNDYWIRGRIASGNYGSVKLKQPSPTSSWEEDLSAIQEPQITKIAITVDNTGSKEQKRPIYCLSYNNLQFSSHIDKEGEFTSSGVKIFNGIKDSFPSIYFGFSHKIEKGPMNIFFNLKGNTTSSHLKQQFFPVFLFEYHSDIDDNWSKISVEDNTKNLTNTGTIRFIFPKDFGSIDLFGRNLFWIKFSDISNIFSILTTLFKQQNDLQSSSQTEDKKLRSKWASFYNQVIDFFPKISSIYENTVSAFNASKIIREVLGSSNGEPNQIFPFEKNITSVQNFVEEIWINEGVNNQISYGGNSQHIEKQNILEVKDEKETLLERWILWNPVKEFSKFGPNDRIYIVNDNDEKKYQFGDGIHGKIPPLGQDNVKITYHSGGGSQGNVDRQEIKVLKSFVPFIESVVNHLPAQGGVDMENKNKLLQRGAHVLQNKKRAITGSDFEWIIYDNFPLLSKVKCFSNINHYGEFEPGSITVAVIPSSRPSEEKPLPSSRMLQSINEFLRNFSSAEILGSKVNVIAPVYASVSVTADIVPFSPDLASNAQTKSAELLNMFFHPVFGGLKGNGWEFGSSVIPADIYEILKKVHEIDKVSSISIRLKYDKEFDKYPITSDSEPQLHLQRVIDLEDSDTSVSRSLKLPPFSMICNGIHTIVIK